MRLGVQVRARLKAQPPRCTLVDVQLGLISNFSLMNSMSKPSILVARAIFPEVLQSLAQVFEVESNQADEVWSAAELTRRMQEDLPCN